MRRLFPALVAAIAALATATPLLAQSDAPQPIRHLAAHRDVVRALRTLAVMGEGTACLRGRMRADTLQLLDLKLTDDGRCPAGTAGVARPWRGDPEHCRFTPLEAERFYTAAPESVWIYVCGNGQLRILRKPYWQPAAGAAGGDRATTPQEDGNR